MEGKKYLLGLLVMLCTFSTKAEIPDSSIVKKIDSLNAVSKANMHMDQELAKSTATEAFDLSSKHNYNKGISRSLYALAQYYKSASIYDTAEYIFKELITLDSSIKELHYLSSDYSNLGSICLSKGNYDKSMDYYLPALRIAEDNGFDDLTGGIYMNMGICYAFMRGSEEKSIESYKKAVEIHSVTPGSERSLALTYMNLGCQYQHQRHMIPEDNPDLIHDYFDKATAYYESVNDTFYLMLIKSYRSSEYSHIGEFPMAYEMVKETQDYFEENGNTRRFINSTVMVASFLSSLDRYEESLYEMERARVLIDSLQLHGYKAFYLKALAGIYDEQKDFELGSQAIREAYALEDSIAGLALSEKLTELEFKYDLSQERADKLAAEAEAVRLEKSEGELKSLVLILVLGFLFLGAVFAIIYRRKQNLKRMEIIGYEKDLADEQQRIAALNLRVLATQMNPHFTKNAIIAIRSLIKEHKIEQSEEYLETFARLQRTILNNASSNTISLKEELKLLEDYVKVERLRMEEKFDVDFRVSDELDVDYDRIPTMMLQPLVENAINHGLFHKQSKGSLKIFLEPDTSGETEALKCTIEDDGVGREFVQKLKSSRKGGVSLKIVKERLQLLSSLSESVNQLKIDDLRDQLNKGIGTKVTITLPFS